MSIDIGHPWARSPSSDALEAGGFLTLTNRGGEADRLTGAASPLALDVELHGIKVVGAGIVMKRLDRGLGLPAGTTITLKPRGYHLLMKGLSAPLVKGQRVPVTLTFEKAGVHEVELVVEAAGPIGNATLFES